MKLYVVVRSDLSRSQQAVQAGHALAELLLWGPAQRISRQWNNHTLVYLRVRDLESLEQLKASLDKYQQYPVAFREPDIDDEMTAFALFESDHVGAMGLLSSLPLV